MIIPENSGWNKRTYHFYLIFGKNSAGKEPWQEKEWDNTIEPLFNKIIGLSPDNKNTGVRVLEMAKQNEGDKYYKQFKLGRIKWDKKSHEKWTLKNNDKRLFEHFASWTPIWTICEKNHLSPDIYLSISNEHYLGSDVKYIFDTLVTIGIAEETGNIPKEIILELSKAFNSKRTVYNKRKWGVGKYDEDKRWSFINSIQDTSSFGMYKNEDIVNSNIHKTEFNKIIFEPYWEIIY
ncbi:hypothetical protein FACS189487_10250 [Campylobacterota bacterium]|nr:hypothetical protein FACS189487_10250 [Campylobacterota bacterium]